MTEEPKIPERESTTGQAALDDPRMFNAMEEYLRLVEDGNGPDMDQFVAGFPGIEAQLRHCLEGLMFVNQAQSAVDSEVPSNTEPIRPLAMLGDFRILEEIGRGGMGIVYRAEQLSLGRRVALKVLPFAAAFDSRRLQRFRNEAQAAATLSHPHIVSIYSVGSERGVHYFAMDLIEGRNLAELLAMQPGEGVIGDKPVSETNAVLSTVDDQPGRRYRLIAKLICDVARALQYAHDQGVVHRDVKPSNLILDDDDKIHVTDFGLARIHGSSDFTLTGDVLGTLRYMSPEQLEGSYVDHRTDIYSLGLTLYELIARVPAFPEENRHKLTHDVLEKRPPSLRSIAPNVPHDLETIVLRATERHAADRYPTAREFADDLQRFMEHRPIRARRQSRVSRFRKWCVRNPLLAAAMTAIFLLLVAGLATTSIQLNRAVAAEKRSLRDLYSTEMQLAYEAWKVGALQQVSDRLEKYAGPKGAGLRGIEWNFLSRQMQSLDHQKRIDCDDAVNNLHFSADGVALFCRVRGELTCWDLHDLRKKSMAWPRSQGAIAFNRDRSRLAAAGDGLYVLDAKSGNPLHRLDESLEGWVAGVRFAPNGRDVYFTTYGYGDDSWTLRRWNPNEPSSQQVPRAIDGVSAFTWSPDGKHLAVIKRETELWLCNPESFAPMKKLGEFAANVTILYFTADSKTLVCGPPCQVYETDVRVRFWDVESQEQIYPLPSEVTIGVEVKCSPSSPLAVVYGSSPGLFSVWDLQTRSHRSFRGHRGPLLGAAWSHDGQQLATASEDGSIRIWRLAQIDPRHSADPQSVDSSVKMLLAGETAYVTSDGPRRELEVQMVNRNGKIGSTSLPQRGVGVPRRMSTNGFAFLNPSEFVTVSAGGAMRFYDLDSKPPSVRTIRDDKLPNNALMDVTVSGDGKYLAMSKIVSWTPLGGEILVWKNTSQSWQIDARLPIPGYTTKLAFSSDATYLACAIGKGGGTIGGDVLLWERNGAGEFDAEFDVLQGHDRVGFHLGFTPDDQYLITSSGDRRVKVWAVKRRECLATLPHFKRVYAAAMSPDGNRILCGTGHGWLYFWDWRTETPLGSLKAGATTIGALEFTDDGKTLVAAHADGQVVFHDVSESGLPSE